MNVWVNVKILSQEQQTAARKTLEALWIRTQGRMPLNHVGTPAISWIFLLTQKGI